MMSCADVEPGFGECVGVAPPQLPDAIVPFAALFFSRFPEVMLALGHPSLINEFELPPARRSFTVLEQTGDYKLVQVVLQRRGATGEMPMMRPRFGLQASVTAASVGATSSSVTGSIDRPRGQGATMPAANTGAALRNTPAPAASAGSSNSSPDISGGSGVSTGFGKATGGIARAPSQPTQQAMNLGGVFRGGCPRQASTPLRNPSFTSSTSSKAPCSAHGEVAALQQPAQAVLPISSVRTSNGPVNATNSCTGPLADECTDQPQQHGQLAQAISDGIEDHPWPTLRARYHSEVHGGMNAVAAITEDTIGSVFVPPLQGSQRRAEEDAEERQPQPPLPAPEKENGVQGQPRGDPATAESGSPKKQRRPREKLRPKTSWYAGSSALGSLKEEPASPRSPGSYDPWGDDVHVQYGGFGMSGKASGAKTSSGVTTAARRFGDAADKRTAN